MTRVWDLFDPDNLAVEIREGFVKPNRHPLLPLTIYTYTRDCQYKGRWNDVTTQCRGLILDDEAYVIARPFPKVFNYGEHGVKDYAPELEPEPFQVFEKVDGSLIILANYENEWIVASKGSFISEQAKWAQRWIDRQPHALHYLDRELTYCAEAVYPQNRIVVNYSGAEDLVFLAAFCDDGAEAYLDCAPLWYLGSRVKSYGSPSLDDLIKRTEENMLIDGSYKITGTDREGFVLRFASGRRVKIKYSEYIRLHRLLTGVTERDIWRALAFDNLLDLGLSTEELMRALKCGPDEIKMMRDSPKSALKTILEGCPDEFDAWVGRIVLKLLKDFDQLMDRVDQVYNQTYRSSQTRREFAIELMESESDGTIKSACFSKLDWKPYEPLLWRSLYPAASTPFKEDE